MSYDEQNYDGWGGSYDPRPTFGGFGPLPVRRPPPPGWPPAPQGNWGPPQGRGPRPPPPGNGRGENVVTRVKAQVGVARPGQILEIARFAAATLANRSPTLYQQYLAGLQVGAQTATSETEGKAALAMIVSDRKTRWRALCEADPDVQYWQQTVDKIKAERGANARVDDIVTDIQDVDLRQYLKGKRVREELLLKAGLIRKDSQLVPIQSTQGEADSQSGVQTPAPQGERKSDGSDPISSLVALVTSLSSRMEGMEIAISNRPNEGSGSGHASVVEGSSVKKAPNPGPRPQV